MPLFLASDAQPEHEYKSLAASEDLNDLPYEDESSLFSLQSQSTDRSAGELCEVMDEKLSLARRRWPSSLQKVLARGAPHLIPSFLRRPSHSPSAAKPLHVTSYLDGLRGIAALCVVGHHATLIFLPHLKMAYGFMGGNRAFVQLPLVRLVTSGEAAVGIFFVISGYALSYKPIRLIHEGRTAGLGETLASSVFRRWFRLYLPICVSTFFAALMTYAGMFKPVNFDEGPVQRPSLTEQLLHWFSELRAMTDPFGLTVGPTYDPNLWTLPREFRASMIIFLVLLCVAQLRKAFRLVVLLGLTCFRLYCGDSNMFLFLGGVVLADMHFLRARHSDVVDLGMQGQQQPRPTSRLWKLFLFLNFMSALWLVGIPQMVAGEAPGYDTIKSWTPAGFPNEFWMHLGAFWLVLTLDNAPFLQRPFNCAFSRYCGKISFALYIVHGPMLKTFARLIRIAFDAIIGNETSAQQTFSLVCTAIVFLPLLIWVTDLFCRLVDEKSVALTRRFEKFCCRAN